MVSVFSSNSPPEGRITVFQTLVNSSFKISNLNKMLLYSSTQDDGYILTAFVKAVTSKVGSLMNLLCA